jgi:hypothetical protein
VELDRDEPPTRRMSHPTGNIESARPHRPLTRWMSHPAGTIERPSLDNGRNLDRDEGVVTETADE